MRRWCNPMYRKMDKSTEHTTLNIATLNQRQWRWFDVATTSCAQWEKGSWPFSSHSWTELTEGKDHGIWKYGRQAHLCYNHHPWSDHYILSREWSQRRRRTKPTSNRCFVCSSIIHTIPWVLGDVAVRSCQSKLKCTKCYDPTRAKMSGYIYSLLVPTLNMWSH